ncbi:hypothetical protein PCL_10368 [Purpureocillium lilacinum]|uniref:glucan endo-1,3-beta-D-glucosidase n=1 Tax=Purpureocillium lilacinum TaxID=33203 RepID=A0A2U3EFV2_PURLI|nr:hypothetical protein PCL_10368 [Purpureocillium lilacinum]
MKSAAPIAALLASAASSGWALVLPAADANRGCSNVSHDVLGNSFCREVEQITYTGLAHKGSYQAVTSMGPSADQCGRQSKEYNSSLGVFEEELSIHIRGPFKLNQMAVYNFGCVNETWHRVSYYNASTQEADNLVFLGNYGGQGSGEFDFPPMIYEYMQVVGLADRTIVFDAHSVWGNSLSYINADATAGSETPEILADVEIPSNKEFAVFSGQKCNGACGFSRVEDVAYHGFGGGNKAFLFDFQMPLDNTTGFNADMPALWALNANIPRTAQYNKCSCWPTCGEFDIYEVLASGDSRCKSTFHAARRGGTSDYFARPSGHAIKIAVVFSAKAEAVSVRVLDYGTVFGHHFTDATVDGWLEGPVDRTAVSTFRVTE